MFWILCLRILCRVVVVCDPVSSCVVLDVIVFVDCELKSFHQDVEDVDVSKQWQQINEITGAGEHTPFGLSALEYHLMCLYLKENGDYVPIPVSVWLIFLVCIVISCRV